MIDKEAARRLVEEYMLAQHTRAHPHVIVEITNKEYGWIFRYLPRSYVETQDPKYLPIGYGLVVVEKEDGTLRALPSYYDAGSAIRAYEKQRGHRRLGVWERLFRR